MSKKLLAIGLAICGVVVVGLMWKGATVEEARAEIDIQESVVVEEPVSSVSVSPEVLEFYDVPLEDSLQSFIFGRCERYGIDPAIVFAMIEVESKFDRDAIGDRGNSLGLMQIQPKWHEERMERLGCDDLLDPYQNVEVGIDYLSELVGMGRGLEWALMAYNGGYSYANAYVSRGEVSHYAREVLDISDELEWK